MTKYYRLGIDFVRSAAGFSGVWKAKKIIDRVIVCGYTICKWGMPHSEKRGIRSAIHDFLHRGFTPVIEGGLEPLEFNGKLGR